jgi:hypothetical protein
MMPIPCRPVCDDELNDFSDSFCNRWLALHWDNEVGYTNLIETEPRALLLSEIDWIGHPAYERIARRTIELYHSRPQLHLLKFLFRSSCFYTSFSALGILAVGHPKDGGTWTRPHPTSTCHALTADTDILYTTNYGCNLLVDSIGPLAGRRAVRRPQ